MTIIALEFLYLGLVTFGGGMAMIPLILDVVLRHGWMTESQFTDLIAISQATPGPIAINMATFVGYRQFAIVGAVVASLCVITPGFIISTGMGRLLERYKDSKTMKNVIGSMSAAVVALLLQALIFIGEKTLFAGSLILLERVVLYIAAFVILKKFKVPLLAMIVIYAVIGILLL